MTISSRLPAAIDTEGLLSHWLLDGNANDAVGGRNGTWNGTAKYRFDSKLGATVAEFNGSSYISFSPVGLPSGAAAGTITMWVKSKSADNGTPFLYGVSGAYGTRVMVILSTFRFGNFSSNIDSGISPLSDGMWHHLAWVYNGASLLGYVDGVLCGTLSATLATGTSYGAMGYQPGYGDYFVGSLGYVRAYNTAKSAAQILAMAQLKA